MEIMGGVILIECDNKLPHEAHSWRDGFLNMQKHSCKGMTPEQFDIYMESKWPTPQDKWQAANPSLGTRVESPHKHQLEYRPSQQNAWVNPERYVWVCKDQKCNHVISSLKEEFRWALLLNDGVATAVPTKIYRKKWQLS